MRVLASLGVGVYVAGWAMAWAYIATAALRPVEAAMLAFIGGVLIAPSIPDLYRILRTPRG